LPILLCMQSGRKQAQAIEARPDPRAGEEWFRKLPEERRAEMTRTFRAGLHRGLDLERDERRRHIREALQMSGIFALFGLLCAGLAIGPALVAGGVGGVLGLICSRLDSGRLMTGALGMLAFFGTQYVLHGSVWTVLFASFPLGALCALLGYQREERGLD